MSARACSRRAGEPAKRVDRLTQELLSGLAILDQPQCPEGDPDRSRGAPVPGELELFAGETACLLLATKGMLGQRGPRPPWVVGGIAHSDRARDLAEREQFRQGLVGSTGFEQHATSRKAQVKLMPWRYVRREGTVYQINSLVEAALDEHLGEEAVTM